MSIFGIIGAALKAPSAVNSTLSLIKQLLSLSTFKSLVTGNPEVEQVEADVVAVEADIEKLKTGFFSAEWFAATEDIAARIVTLAGQLLAVFRDPALLADGALTGLVTQIYSTVKGDISVLNALGVKVAIPAAVTSVVSAVTATPTKAVSLPTTASAPFPAPPVVSLSSPGTETVTTSVTAPIVATSEVVAEPGFSQTSGDGTGEPSAETVIPPAQPSDLSGFQPN
jgi:hypothetical protein